VYEKNWLRDFFTQTLENENISVDTFEEFYSTNPPIALSYLPTVSYFEMGEWSMTSKDTLALEHLLENNPEAHQFIRGGTWKNFFTKYQESNWIHKRYIELSKKQDSQEKYTEALYKAQCNDVLWHGVFGGIYLPNLRDNAYKYIIECEKLSAIKKENLDIDFDGYDEYKYNTNELLTIVSLKNGGQIFELDILEKNFNLQNTLTRYEEAYHSKIEVNKEEELTTPLASDDIATIHDNKLIVDEDISLVTDWYFKKSAIDHIVPNNTTAMDFYNSSFHELSDFTNQPFALKKAKSKTLTLVRDGGIFTDTKFETTLEKKYQFIKNSINLNISIDTQYDAPLLYIQEWNLHFASLENLTFNGLIIAEQLKSQPYTLTTQCLEIYDSYLDKTLIFSFEKEIEIIIFTLNSVSQSEQGVDLTNQGLTFGFVYPFTQTEQNSLQFEIR
jgi:hypothetical protein